MMLDHQNKTVSSNHKSQIHILSVLYKDYSSLTIQLSGSLDTWDMLQNGTSASCMHVMNKRRINYLRLNNHSIFYCVNQLGDSVSLYTQSFVFRFELDIDPVKANSLQVDQMYYQPFLAYLA